MVINDLVSNETAAGAHSQQGHGKNKADDLPDTYQRLPEDMRLITCEPQPGHTSGLEVTLATQSLNRLKTINGELVLSMISSVGNIIALRSGPRDADLLADWIGTGVRR